MERYPIPARLTRIETEVQSSRFIATLSPAFSVDEARLFIQKVRSEFHDATHNVPAFVIGHGASQITHSSDDGEPSGTAGRPALAVLAGSGLGDAVVVVTRYFGGIKLGTGGLVRAYQDSVQRVIAAAERAVKVPVDTVMISAPYAWFDRLKQMVASHGGRIVDREFAAEVTLSAAFPAERTPEFRRALRDVSHGSLDVVLISTQIEIIPLGEAQ